MKKVLPFVDRLTTIFGFRGHAAPTLTPEMLQEYQPTTVESDDESSEERAYRIAFIEALRKSK